MFTRCPQCKTVHPLNAQVLSHARGLVQCASCGKKFSALHCLFDQWPAGQAHSPRSGHDTNPPVIGKAGDKKVPVNTQQPAGPDTPDSDPHRLAWGLMTALLVLITIANTTWTFRETLLQVPTVYAWLENNGWLQAKQEGLLKDPAQIQLTSRDMHAHPTRTGILVLSLTFVNLARHPQVFPILRITLLDGSNQPIAQRRFQPADYLRSGANTQAGLATYVFLPVLLELGDPGEQAVGFEIQFL